MTFEKAENRARSLLEGTLMHVITNKWRSRSFGDRTVLAKDAAQCAK
jgi:hypothetical protein